MKSNRILIFYYFNFLEVKMKQDNTTPYQSQDYDANVINTLPYYQSYHQKTINIIKPIKSTPKIWLDTGVEQGH